MRSDKVSYKNKPMYFAKKEPILDKIDKEWLSFPHSVLKSKERINFTK